MAYGLQIFNPAGNLVSDFRDPIATFVYSGNITLTQTTRIRINIAEMTNSPEWYVNIERFIASSSEDYITSISPIFFEIFTGYFEVYSVVGAADFVVSVSVVRLA